MYIKVKKFDNSKINVKIFKHTQNMCMIIVTFVYI